MSLREVRQSFMADDEACLGGRQAISILDCFAHGVYTERSERVRSQ